MYDNHSPRTEEMVKIRNQKTFRRNPCEEKQGLNQGSRNEGVQRRQMCLSQPSFSLTNAGPLLTKLLCLPALLNPHTLWPPCLLKVSFLEQLLNDSPEHVLPPLPEELTRDLSEDSYFRKPSLTFPDLDE